MRFATLFAQSAIAASFDAIVTRDAQSGRVNHQFRSLLDTCYSLALPASPAKFVDAVNAMRLEPVMRKFDKGAGAVKGAKAVHEALAAMVQLIIDGGAVKGLPALAAVPTWLQDKPKAPAKDPAADAGTPAAGADSDEGETITPAADAQPTAGAALIAEAQDALIKVLALLKAGHYDADQRAALYTVLETTNAAPIAADAKAARKPRRTTKQEQADKAVA